MKKLLATSALVLVAASGAASAQSVLERVLGSINVDNTNMLPVTGTFANIAENIAVLGNSPEYSVTATGTGSTLVPALAAGSTQAQYDAWAAKNTTVATYSSVAGNEYHYNAATGIVLTDAQFNTLSPSEAAGYATLPALSTLVKNGDGTFTTVTTTDLATLQDNRATAMRNVVSAATGPSVILNEINGSVTNSLTGVTTSTASVNGTVLAIDQVKVDIGNVATTVLGAVNTGTTSLGVNSDYNQAIAGTSEAVSGKVQQLGGIADQTALVLNVASNATSVVGSVQNTFSALNGSVGNIATTVLGAVNTGTISSGVNAASNGIVAGIVGTTTP